MIRTALLDSGTGRAALQQFQRWFLQAQRVKEQLPEAMALATADAHGKPAVRFVLLKEATPSGFVFYTNALSRKGRELRDNPHAAAAFHWVRLSKQVRIEGRIEVVADAVADAYWATRPRASQLAALASTQSAEIASRHELMQTWKRLRRELRGKAVPRPRKWTGFRIVPTAIEFWTHHDHRLHHRVLFVRTRHAWQRKLLQP